MPTATWARIDESRRRAVLEAAEAEFAAQGFSGGSLNVIARNAGVAKGSLFQYFTDKADLYAHLSGIASLRIRAHMEHEIGRLTQDAAGAGFFDLVRLLIHEWVRYFKTHPVDLALTAAVNLEPDPTAREAVRGAVHEHYLAVLRPLVAHGEQSGALRPGVDLDAFLAMLLLILPHLALASTGPGLDPVLGLDSVDETRAAAAVDRMVDVLVAAFGAVPYPSSAR